MVGPARPLFVLFGSSIVEFSFNKGGWGAMLADVYCRKADILVRGYGGWNTRRALEAVDKIFPKDAPVQPSLVIAYLCGNDSMGAHPSGLGPHVPLPEYIENLKKILNHLKSLSETTRVIILTCPPVNEEMYRQFSRDHLDVLAEIIRTNEDLHKYSEACIRVCKEMDVKVIDLFTVIQKREDWVTSCLDAHDGVHFSSEGNKIVVEEILKVLKGAEWQPSLHWKSLPTEFSEDSVHDLVAADGKSTVNPTKLTIFKEIQFD